MSASRRCLRASTRPPDAPPPHADGGHDARAGAGRTVFASVDEQVLDDLRARLRATRLPGRSPAVPWEQGTDLDYLRALLRYWAEEFDWRVQERELNTFNHSVLSSTGWRFISCMSELEPAPGSR
jgi:hypothetical protein